MRSRHTRSGQAATEYMLLVSVVVIAVTAAAYEFVPSFRSGVAALGQDVSTLLSTGFLGDYGVDRSPEAMRADTPSNCPKCPQRSPTSTGAPVGGPVQQPAVKPTQ